MIKEKKSPTLLSVRNNPLLWEAMQDVWRSRKDLEGNISKTISLAIYKLSKGTAGNYMVDPMSTAEPQAPVVTALPKEESQEITADSDIWD